MGDSGMRGKQTADSGVSSGIIACGVAGQSVACAGPGSL